jgi:hypothetical protein
LGNLIWILSQALEVRFWLILLKKAVLPSLAHKKPRKSLLEAVLREIWSSSDPAFIQISTSAAHFRRQNLKREFFNRIG